MTQGSDQGGSRSLGGRAFQDAGPETENDRGPRVGVSVPRVNSLLADCVGVNKMLTATTTDSD